MVTIAPASRSYSTVGRFAARSAACWQELAEVAVSGDDDQGAGGGVVEDGPVVP
jgi:hypothetical protein